MDVESHGKSKMLSLGRRTGKDRRQTLSGTSPVNPWITWADGLWSEVARVHTLIDKVNAEMSQMLDDNSTHALQVIEKNAELRVLHAYYKGLRFAIEQPKENGGPPLIPSINRRVDKAEWPARYDSSPE